MGPLLVALALGLGPAAGAPPADGPRIQGPRRVTGTTTTSPTPTSPSPTSPSPTSPPPSAETSDPTAIGPAEPPAADRPIDLVWTAPSGCPAADEVARQLDDLLGDRDPTAPWVRVRAEVTAVEHGYSMALTTETTSGTTTHTLSSPDCAALANAVALVAAVAADPMAVDRKLDRDAALAREAVVETAPPVSKPVVTPPVTKRPRLRLARFALRADGVLDYNVVPRVGFGPVITLGIFGPHWRTEVGAIYVAARTTWLDAAKTAGADIGMWALRVRGCGVPVASTVEFPICAALEGGQLMARPLGAGAPPETDTPAWGAFSLGSMVAWSPRPFIALVLGLDLVVPFRRTKFRVPGVAGAPDGPVLHQVGRVGLRTNIGIELRVP